MTYRSTAIRRHGGDLVVDGELTIRGVTGHRIGEAQPDLRAWMRSP